MASPNIQNMLEQGKRALREGNNLEAQKFLLRITELDQYNEEAWLWLASAVETKEEQRTCLDNVLIINPNNAEAKRMIAELNRGGEASILDSDPFADAGFGADDFSEAGASGGSEPAFDIGDNPFGDSGGSFSGGAFTTDDPFGGSFDMEEAEDDAAPFTAQGFDFSAEEPAAPPPPPTQPPPNTPPPTTAPPAYDTPSEPEQTESLDDLGIFDSSASVSNQGIYSDGSSPDADDLGYDPTDEEIDYLTEIPPDIKPTRVPGTDEATAQGLVIGVSILGILNVVALLLLVIQLVT